MTNARQFILLGLLSGYLLLNYAFMQYRVPPSGFGIPLGELFLFFSFVTFNMPLALRKMGSMVNLLPFLVWWGFGLGRMIFDGMDRGYWSFRDATPLIESLYIMVGFAIAGSDKFLERFMRWLPILLLVACIYAMGFPFQEQIALISPSIPGVSGGLGLPIPVVGTFDTSATLLLWSAFYLLCAGQHKGLALVLRIVVASGLIAFAVVVVQARTVYTQFIGLAFIFLLFRRRSLAQMSLALPILIFVIAVISAFDLHVSGRLTDKISFSFFEEHLGAIFGEQSSNGGVVNQAADGVNLRFGWWQNLYVRLTDNAVYLLTGLGYGVPLTNFIATGGAIVREPHNSFISVVSRLGVIGFGAWIWMAAEILKVWYRALIDAKRLRWRKGQDFLLVIVAYGALILISALGEDALEKPYNAIPFYCFLGIALRLGYLLRQRSAVKAAQPVPRRRPLPSPAGFLNPTQMPEHSR